VSAVDRLETLAALYADAERRRIALDAVEAACHYKHGSEGGVRLAYIWDACKQLDSCCLVLSSTRLTDELAALVDEGQVETTLDNETQTYLFRLKQ